LPEAITLPFVILGVMTIAGAAAALTLRNLVHCVLALSVAFAGLAGLYLCLSAQFLGFAQVLVYVGAVAILIVFAVMLTRGAEESSQLKISASRGTGIVIAACVFGVLGWTVLSSAVTRNALQTRPEATVKQIGTSLMTEFALPLEVIGLLLTAALVGAVTIAMKERRRAR
jgi:NADH:ubiquinone oxidoreductase subunit 6 (subunit J)